MWRIVVNIKDLKSPSLDNLRLPILFVLGVLIALIANIVCDGDYGSKQIAYAQKAAVSVFVNSGGVLDTFASTMLSSANQLIMLLVVSLSAITLYPKFFISSASLIKGYTFGRFCGCTVTFFGFPASIIPILFSAVMSLLFLYHSRSMIFTSKKIAAKEGGEVSSIFSAETLEIFNKTLSSTGTVVLISIIKSFLLWLCSLL